MNAPKFALSFVVTMPRPLLKSLSRTRLVSRTSPSKAAQY